MPTNVVNTAHTFAGRQTTTSAGSIVGAAVRAGVMRLSQPKNRPSGMPMRVIAIADLIVLSNEKVKDTIAKLRCVTAGWVAAPPPEHGNHSMRSRSHPPGFPRAALLG